MKRIIFMFIGACIGVALSIALAYVIGQFWGPIAQGEDEAARHFKIFIFVTSLLLVSGGWLGFRLAKPKQNNAY
ncbi:hypothetical protein ACVFI8_09590 [Agarivorans sp. MS3-6]|uniref:hypothetical protein n=1 Tax=Agarivorans sp. TSD2052 TaxID=2937286 RepID=UPI00200CEF36|nr:hypothetical protein [Agarivorans sp. TSD2052]UPW18753.1 hypothetical protein M0C34_00320 [Agarivorans sp. TSD2052]